MWLRFCLAHYLSSSRPWFSQPQTLNATPSVKLLNLLEVSLLVLFHMYRSHYPFFFFLNDPPPPDFSPLPPPAPLRFCGLHPRRHHVTAGPPPPHRLISPARPGGAPRKNPPMAGRAEHPRHADHPFAREPGDLLRDPAHH